MTFHDNFFHDCGNPEHLINELINQTTRHAEGMLSPKFIIPKIPELAAAIAVEQSALAVGLLAVGHLLLPVVAAVEEKQVMPLNTYFD